MWPGSMPEIVKIGRNCCGIKIAKSRMWRRAWPTNSKFSNWTLKVTKKQKMKSRFWKWKSKIWNKMQPRNHWLKLKTAWNTTISCMSTRISRGRPRPTSYSWKMLSLKSEFCRSKVVTTHKSLICSSKSTITSAKRIWMLTLRSEIWRQSGVQLTNNWTWHLKSFKKLSNSFPRKRPKIKSLGWELKH